MTLKRCSREAHIRCPLRAWCDPPGEACYAQGSDCDKYNETIDFLLKYRENLRKEAAGNV